ncbi:MAG TPA: hypothetical protein VHF22_12630, partial [Planctomycetota bacterium]|nr:hypothetical protein [Planctomycetota bacterium]
MKTGKLAGALAALFFVLALAGPARADHAALEQEGLAKESRLDYDGAFDAYAAALRAAIAEAKGERREAGLAAAEVYVFKLAFLAERTARWKDLGEALAEARKAVLPPTLDARAAWYQSRAALASADVPRARKILEPLGFLTRFAIAGPFENDRGGGYGTAYEPEQGPIDLAARYAGKGREIGWRIPPQDAFLGEVDLDAMIRPNDECLAYALTYVKWEGGPHTAALRLGSDEGAKAWWNDALVLARDVNRTLELDQDAVPIVLRKGWNRLLLKVTERKGAWAFLARITEPDGAPLAQPLAIEPRVAIADARVEAEAKGAPETPVKVSRGAIDYYEALEKSGKATAQDLFQLGYVYYRRKAHDENAHPDREAFKAAVALDPKSSVYHAYLSFVSAATGEFSVNREENARRAELERALELDPQSARVALILAEYYLRSMRNPEKAETFCDRALAVAPRSIDALLLKAELQGRQGFGGYARDLVFKLEKDPAAQRSPAALGRIAG